MPFLLPRGEGDHRARRVVPEVEPLAHLAAAHRQQHCAVADDLLLRHPLQPGFDSILTPQVINWEEMMAIWDAVYREDLRVRLPRLTRPPVGSVLCRPA